MPVKAAGWRIDPPVSVAVAAAQIWAATAVADPPDDPPGVNLVLEPFERQGLTTGPNALDSLEDRWMDHLAGPIDIGQIAVGCALGYLDFLALMDSAALVLTDSGGVQEETTCLGVPCITMRDNTERPITVEQGTNEVVGTNPNVAVRRALQRLSEPTLVRRPPLWDGCTAGRIVTALQSQPVFN